MDDDELTPQQAERVRRLLADARHTEPIPEDVAARIDRALADLAAEPEPVVHLAERRRTAGRLLLAAAVVVVGGVAIGQVVGLGGMQAGMESQTAGSAGGDSEGNELSAPDRDGTVEQGETAGGDSVPGAVSDTRRSLSKQPPRRIRSREFAADAERLRGLAARQADRDTAALPQTGTNFAEKSCAAGAWGGGRYVRVVLDGEAGWLVYRAPRGATQVVDLFLCDSDSPERSATLPFDG